MNGSSFEILARMIASYISVFGRGGWYDGIGLRDKCQSMLLDLLFFL